MQGEVEVEDGNAEETEGEERVKKRAEKRVQRQEGEGTGVDDDFQVGRVHQRRCGAITTMVSRPAKHMGATARKVARYWRTVLFNKL